MRLVTVIDKIERILISALFAVMVLAVFSQVVNRNIFKLEIGWFEEVARACMVYIILFAAEIGLRDHSQLNIDSLVRRLPPKVAGLLQDVSTIVTIIFGGAYFFPAPSDPGCCPIGHTRFGYAHLGASGIHHGGVCVDFCYSVHHSA